MSKFLRKLRYFSPLAGVLAVVWMSVQYGGSNELLFLVPLYFVGATLGTIMFSFFIEWLLSKDKWVVSAWQKRLIVVSECAAIFLLFEMPPYRSTVDDSIQSVIYYLMAGGAVLMLLATLYGVIKIIASLIKHKRNPDEYIVYFFVYAILGYLLMKLLVYRFDLDVRPSEFLSTQEILDLAYTDELKAEGVYNAVIDLFGEQRPFTRIVDAEVKHSSAILELYKYFALTPPLVLSDDIFVFDSVAEACRAGVEGENANIALYDDLIAQTSEREIATVFEKLQRASRDNHLPAFERCSR